MEESAESLGFSHAPNQIDSRNALTRATSWESDHCHRINNRNLARITCPIAQIYGGRKDHCPNCVCNIATMHNLSFRATVYGDWHYVETNAFVEQEGITPMCALTGDEFLATHGQVEFETQAVNSPLTFTVE